MEFDQLPPQLRAVLRSLAHAVRSREPAIRNHDPCISCSTHFLDLTVVRTSGGSDA